MCPPENHFKRRVEEIERDPEPFAIYFIPPGPADKAFPDPSPFNSNTAYFRIVLVRMRLMFDAKYFRKYYPVVHSRVTFTHAGQQVALPSISGPDFIKGITEAGLNNVIVCNHPLISLCPFIGGTVKIEAGLFRMVAEDKVKRFSGVLEALSTLLPVPQLSKVVAFAKPIMDGIGNLMDTGEGAVELGWEDTFVEAGSGGNELRPGHFFLARRPPTAIEKEMLCVIDGEPRLKDASGSSQPLPLGFPYMLFRIEKEDGLDWEMFSEISELVNSIVESLVRGNNEEAEKTKDAVKIEIVKSPDITRLDRQQMILKIENYLKQYGSQPSESGPAVRETAGFSIEAGTRPEVPLSVETRFASFSGLAEEAPRVSLSRIMEGPPLPVTEVMRSELLRAETRLRRVELDQSLRDEYESLFSKCIIGPDHVSQVDNIVAKITKNKDKYEEVGGKLGVPWYIVAVIHNMESSLDFSKHLHNGDPLGERTVHVPAGRPKDGKPPFTWVVSAIDALGLKRFDAWHDWSVAGMLYKLEAYNGWGYRLHHPKVLSPYLWSFSNHYTSGKYVADGKWSDTAVSKQVGAAVLLRRMLEQGIIELPSA